MNEFTVGINRGEQNIMPQNQAALNLVNRGALGLTLPQYFPQNNPLDLIPNTTFGGVSNAPALAIEARFPYAGTADIWNYSDNLSKVFKSHMFKAGIFIENDSRNGNRTGTNFGQLAFDRDPNDPNDTNYAFSNALLGTATTYSESTARPYSHGRYQNYEWFAQDSWRVTKRLTLDLGLRFYVIVPSYNESGQLSNFVPSLYNRSQAPLLIVPYQATPTSPRIGLNPVTGQTVPAVLIGSYVPGSGNPYNGLQVTNQQAMQIPSVQLAPRFGFAYDVFGDGKMAIRGGFGIFADRFPDTDSLQLVQQPPLNNTLTANYTTLSQLLVRGSQCESGQPECHSDSLRSADGLQLQLRDTARHRFRHGPRRCLRRELGSSPAAESKSQRSAVWDRLPAVEPGSDQSRTSVACEFSAPVPRLWRHSLLRIRRQLELPFDADAAEQTGQSQSRVRRRLDLVEVHGYERGRQYQSSDQLQDSQLRQSSVRPDTHNFVANYVYSLPNVAGRWNNSAGRVALNGWQISGVTSLISGAPLGITYSFIQSLDVTGTTGSPKRRYARQCDRQSRVAEGPAHAAQGV